MAAAATRLGSGSPPGHCGARDPRAPRGEQHRHKRGEHVARPRPHPSSGTWERRRADLYAAAEDWLGPSKATAAEGLELLVRRYLGAFGPAPVADIVNWMGVPPGHVVPALERLKLRRFADDAGEELIDLPRAPLPDPDTPAPVRFLPTWDASLLVHARRTGILAEEHRARCSARRRRSRLAPSWSTAAWPGPGPTRRTR